MKKKAPKVHGRIEDGILIKDGKKVVKNIFDCSYCQHRFERSDSDVRAGRTKYCSVVCAGRANRKYYPKPEISQFSGEAVLIPLGNTGVEILVNEEYADWLNHWSWQISPQGYGWRYDRSNKRVIWLHREILYPPDGLFIDHINGNRQDNRYENLRVVTSSVNNSNRVNGKGYTKIPWGKHTYYQARFKGKYLGNFKTPEEAHAVYAVAKDNYIEEAVNAI